MATYAARCPHCGKMEVEKAMTAPWPSCPICGRALTKIFTPNAVIFNVTGFYATDYARFESQVGPERAARFRAQKAEAEKRAATGRLTQYEKALESI